MLTKKNPLLYLKIVADGASSRMLHQVAMTVGTVIYHWKSQNAITLLQVSTWTLQNAASTYMIYLVLAPLGQASLEKLQKLHSYGLGGLGTFLRSQDIGDVYPRIQNKLFKYLE